MWANLGWELHHPIDQMPVLYEALLAEESKRGMTHFGSYAMNVMRIEKGYKALGNELTTGSLLLKLVLIVSLSP